MQQQKNKAIPTNIHTKYNGAIQKEQVKSQNLDLCSNVKIKHWSEYTRCSGKKKKSNKLPGFLLAFLVTTMKTFSDPILTYMVPFKYTLLLVSSSKLFTS